MCKEYIPKGCRFFSEQTQFNAAAEGLGPSDYIPGGCKFKSRLEPVFIAWLFVMPLGSLQVQKSTRRAWLNQSSGHVVTAANQMQGQAEQGVGEVATASLVAWASLSTKLTK